MVILWEYFFFLRMYYNFSQESPYHAVHQQKWHFAASNLILTPHQVQKIKMRTKQQIKTIKTPKCPWIKAPKCPWFQNSKPTPGSAASNPAGALDMPWPTVGVTHLRRISSFSAKLNWKTPKNTNPTSKIYSNASKIDFNASTIDSNASTIDSNASKLILDSKLKLRGGRLTLFEILSS